MDSKLDHEYPCNENFIKIQVCIIENLLSFIIVNNHKKYSKHLKKILQRFGTYL